MNKNFSFSYPYDYIRICNNTNFVAFYSGIEPVVKYVNSKGFKCGIVRDKIVLLDIRCHSLCFAFVSTQMLG